MRSPRSSVGFLFLSALAPLAAGCEVPAQPSVSANTPVAEVSSASPPVDPAADAKLRIAVASGDRPAAEVARDKYRHPLETLEFFGIRDDMTVLELWPGSGWYTAVLAPYLGEKGKLVVTALVPDGEGGKQYAARLAAKPEDFGKVEVRRLHPPADLTLGPDGSVDAVVTFRNVHNWVTDGIADKIFAATFRVLKPGGVFGIVDHRAKADADPTKVAASGYVPEAFVIDLAQKAGFRLDGRAEINANPKDTKDWPKGVWTLPPVYRLGDQDHAKYEAIGESDRMTLRFRKP